MKQRKSTLKKWISLTLCAAMLCSPLTAMAEGPNGGSTPSLLRIKTVADVRVEHGSTLEQVQAALPATVNVVLKGENPTLPAEEVLFEDDFSSAATSAEKWDTTYDPDKVVNFTDGKLSVGRSTNLKLLANVKTSTDFVVEATVTGPADPTNNFGIMFRSSDVTDKNADSYNGYYVGVGYSGESKSNGMCIGYADGSWHYINSPVFDYKAGQPYTIKVVAYQDTITAFLNGAKMYQFKDSKFSGDLIGLRSYAQPFEATAFKVRSVTNADLDECGIVNELEATADVAEWTCADYDGNTSKTYAFTGTLAETAAFTNDDNLTVSANVIVKKPIGGADDNTAHAVDFTQVHITDDFWAPRQKQFICEVIPIGIANVEKGTGGIPNIKNAALKNRGESYGGFSGAFYVDSDVHKVLESMCLALQVDAKGDQEIMDGQQYIKEKLEEWIPYYVDAQEADGYFDTYFTLQGGSTPKWTDFNLHELYCAGHFYEAAVAHYRATGDTRLLDVAVKNADYVESLFGPGKWKQVPGHQEIELALIKLANLCTEIGELNGVNYGEKADKYIALSKFFLDTRGDYEGRHGTNHNSSYDQDHAPVTEQTKAVGHAVRAQYMYTGMADVALQEGTDEYNDALLALWDDVTNTQQYVTGGIGSNPGNEGFGTSYDLPNDTAYCETCAQVANAMWNQRMNLLFSESKYADKMELTLYNSIISCVNYDGDKFFYGNPMSSGGGKTRSSWFGTACCPPNLMRTVMNLGGYIYTQKGNEVTMNLYIANNATLNVGGKPVKLNLESDMPWEGTSKLTVGVDEAQQFSIRFRVPDWATGENTVMVGGEAVSATPDANGYVVIDRVWNDGDTVELNFPMEATRVYADERVEADRGFTAVKRGPIVYAAEGADNDFKFNMATLPTDSEFTTEWVENLDGEPDPYGIKSVLKIKAPGKLQSLSADGFDEITWTLIPYYSWCNREKNNMVVYIKEEPWDLDEAALELFATPTASFTSPYDSVGNLNDGSDNRWTAYSYKGSTNPWVQYDFDVDVTLWGSNIKWYDDGGGVQVPTGLDIQYWDGTQFVSVNKIGEYDTFIKSQENIYRFQPVVTNKIRLVITPKGALSSSGSGMPGIMEWKLLGQIGTVDIDRPEITAVRYGDMPFGTDYDKFNVATFAPATSQSFRMVTTNPKKPVGLREFRILTTDGEYVEQEASLTASYTCEQWSTITGINNGKWDDSSIYNGTDDVWSTYPETGENGVHWVQFDFAEPKTVAQAEAFWYRAWDDGVTKPDSWTFQYLDESGEWKDVERFEGQIVDFDNNITEYDVDLPVGANVPFVVADYDENLAIVEIQQPTELPGDAIISIKTVSGTDERLYTIHFAEKEEPVVPLESLAVPTASYTSPYDKVEGLNDGEAGYQHRWSSYLYTGTEEIWVQYDFDQDVTLWGSNINWYADGGGVKVPAGLDIQVWNGTEFVSVGEYDNFVANSDNVYNFPAVTTQKIRLVLTSAGSNGQGMPGITEWKLIGKLGSEAPADPTVTGMTYGDYPFTTVYDKFNLATFAPVTSTQFRMLADGGEKPVGLEEFRVLTEDGNNIAIDATLSASYTCEQYSTIDAINNGVWGETTTTETWSTWPEAGEQWVQFDFAEPQTVAAVEAYWYRAWDDGVVAPESWKLQYFADGEWKDVERSTEQLADFDKNVYEYEVTLPADAKLPCVEVSTDGMVAAIETEQVSELPGDAIVTVKAVSGNEKTYTIHFAVEGEIPSDVDKSMLESLIKAIDGVFEEARYTEESWAAFD
ncbi:glycoside hydrolase family 127 protein, partial [Clostridiaceae bacterium NSJ-31]